MKSAALGSLLLGGLLLLSGLAGGLWLLPSAPSIPSRTPSGISYVAEASPPPSPPAGGLWMEPVGQSSGSAWVFEVFTPPLIFFNEATRTFTLTPPLTVPEITAWEVTLLEVSRPLYRLQYAGHSGDGARALIEIRDEANHTWWRGRVGERIPEAAFRIESFVAERVRVAPEEPGGTPYVETAIKLVVFDEVLGEVITLAAAPRYLDTAQAVLGGPDGSRVCLEIGETSMLGGAMYRLDAIAWPHQATVTRLADGPVAAETRPLAAVVPLVTPGGLPSSVF